MKIEFNENQYGTDFQLTPETPQEVAQLARFVKSSKREIPELFLSFSGETPYCNVSFAKKAINVQHNSINNKA